MGRRFSLGTDQFSLEAISQQSGALFAELTKAVGFLRTENTYTTESVKSSEIMDVVKAYTNMSIQFNIGNYREAHIRLPMLDANHPFIRDYMRKYGSYDTGVQLIRALGGSATGGVSLKEGKVFGVYGDIVGYVCMGVGFFRDRRYSDSELAAIILHELGHLFTYFELLGSVVMTSHVISCAAKTMVDTEDYEKRLTVLKEAEQVLGIEVPDKDRVASKNKLVRSLSTQVALITATSKTQRSETGNSIYEMRSCEQIADQFAARHGAAKDLVLALDRLYRDHYDTSTMSMFEHVVIEVCKVIFFLCAAILAPGPVIVWLVFFNPTHKIYDDPAQRVKLLKQQAINELKDKKLDDDRRDTILKDLDIMEEVEDGLDDKRSLLEVFWTTIIPSGVSAASQEKGAKQLEELINNQLFVQSAKLKQLN